MLVQPQFLSEIVPFPQTAITHNNLNDRDVKWCSTGKSAGALQRNSDPAEPGDDAAAISKPAFRALFGPFVYPPEIPAALIS
jgi:hypothetical protein